MIVRVLVVAGAVLLLTAVTVQVRDALLDSDEFADRVVAAASTPEVQAELADQIVDQIVATDADLLLYRPIIEGIVEGLVESDLFEDVLRFGLADLHRSSFTNANDTLTVVVSDMILLVKVSLSKVDAEATALIPDELTDAVISVKLNPVLVDLAQFAEQLRALAFVCPVLAFASIVGALWSNADIADARPVLEARLEDCDRERGLFPNMIAVDFSDRGDTLAIVDELNGLDGAG